MPRPPIPPSVKTAIWKALAAGNNLDRQIHLPPDKLQEYRRCSVKELRAILAPGDYAIFDCWRSLMDLKDLLEDPVLNAEREAFGESTDICAVVEAELRDHVVSGYSAKECLAINYQIVEELLGHVLELREDRRLLDRLGEDLKGGGAAPIVEIANAMAEPPFDIRAALEKVQR